MLSFEKTDTHYRITQTLMGWHKNTVSTVDYKLNLSEKRCGNEPWTPTTNGDVEWFNKNYLPKFNILDK